MSNDNVAVLLSGTTLRMKLSPTRVFPASEPKLLRLPTPALKLMLLRDAEFACSEDKLPSAIVQPSRVPEKVW